MVEPHLSRSPFPYQGSALPSVSLFRICLTDSTLYHHFSRSPALLPVLFIRTVIEKRNHGQTLSLRRLAQHMKIAIRR